MSNKIYVSKPAPPTGVPEPIPEHGQFITLGRQEGEAIIHPSIFREFIRNDFGKFTADVIISTDELAKLNVLTHEFQKSLSKFADKVDIRNVASTDYPTRIAWPMTGPKASRTLDTLRNGERFDDINKRLLNNQCPTSVTVVVKPWARSDNGKMLIGFALTLDKIVF